MGNATGFRVVAFGFGGNEDIERGVLSGKVTAALRLRREANPGDVLQARTLGAYLQVDSVQLIRLSRAAALHHKAMGFSTAAAFLADWARSHRRIGANKDVYAFLFRFHQTRSPFHVVVEEGSEHALQEAK